MKQDNRWLLPLLVSLAFAAAGISLMLTSYHFSQGKEPWALFSLACKTEEGGCAEVLASSWATLPGNIPLAALGVLYFGGLGLWYLAVGAANRRGRLWQALPLAAQFLGVIASCFLLLVMLSGLHAVCWWCALSHLLNFALLGLALALWPREGEPGEPARPGPRLGFAGLLLALAWFVVCAQALLVRQLRLSTEKANEYARELYQDTDLQRYLHLRDNPAVEIAVRADDPARGNPMAPHTAVVFSDFQCPGCRAFAAFFETRVAPLAGGRLKLVYKHFPLDPDCNPALSAAVHPQACEAAGAAEAARALAGNEGFWKIHDRMFREQEALAGGAWGDLAGKTGLPAPAILERVGRGAYRDRILEDVALGRQLGLEQTPTVYLDGRKLEDWRRIDLWKALIQ